MAYYVSSGQISSGIILNNARMDVYYSGTAIDTTVNEGDLYVYSGGTADNTTVNSIGYLYVSSGGTANSTTVNYSGRMYISGGGTADNTTVNKDGDMYVYSGGTADNTTVNYSGHLYVYSGATAVVAYNPWQGTVYSSAGASVTYLDRDAEIYYRNSNGIVFKYNNVAENLTLEYADFAVIYAGGTANNTTVTSCGSMTVYGGGTANNTIVNSNAELFVCGYSGTANNTTVNAYGDMTVYSGGTANSTTVNSRGGLYVDDGGTANNTTVNEGGYLYVGDGGTANNTTINSGGRLTIITIDESGGMANSATVNSGGYLYVYGGTAAEIVENGGYVYVADDAEVTFTPNVFSGLVLSNGSATLHSGTTANSTTVNSNGILSVSSGGMAANATVNSGGSLNVSRGGTATDIVRTSGGWLGLTVAPDTYIQGTSDGSAFEMKNAFISGYTVNSGVNLDVDDGGMAANTAVNSGGYLYVSSGGTANSATVNSNGRLYVYIGGTADHTTVKSYGYLYVSSGGMADNTTVNSNGRLYVYIGGTADHTIVKSYGYLYVSSGGMADNTTVNFSGYLYVFSGATVNNTTVNSGGLLFVSSGATAVVAYNPWQGTVYSSAGASVTYLDRDAEIYYRNSNGIVFKYNNVAENLTLEYADFAVIYAGGTANNTTVNSDGVLSVSSGGMADNTTVNSGGRLYITSGGMADNTTVNSSGGLYVDDGGTANNTTVNSGGYLYVSSGATATDIERTSGGRLGLTVAPNTYIQGTSDGSAFEMKNAFISGYTVNSYDRLYISSGGMADNTTVNSRGALYVYSGGTANNTTVNSYGYLYVSSGGTAANATVNFSGYLSVSPRGKAESTTVNSRGSLYVYSGGTAESTTVNSGGYLYVYGGTAAEIVENGGYVYVAHDAEVTFTPNVFSGLVLSDGSATLHSGTTANYITVNYRGYLHVFSGATAVIVYNPWQGTVYSSAGASVTYLDRDAEIYYRNSNGIVFKYSSAAENLTIGHAGHAIIYAGGTANNTTVQSYGYLYVSSGGTAANATVNSHGSMYVCGGTANNTTVNSYGYLYVDGGGTAANTTVQSYGRLYISSRGMADHTTVQSYGYLYVSSGGMADNTTVQSYGYLYVFSGGTANSTTVNSYGSMYVSSGGMADNTTIYSGGSMTVDGGGKAEITTVNSGGYLYVYGGTAAEIVENGGYVYVADDAEVTFTPNVFNGLVLSDGSATLHSGTTANSTTVQSYGYLYVFSGGTANSTTVNSYGSMYVSCRGTANSTTVNSYGSMYVSSGGMADNTTIYSGGVLYVYSGATAFIAYNPWQGSIVSSTGASVTYLEHDAKVYFGGVSGLISKGDTMEGVSVGSGWEIIVYSGGVVNAPILNRGGSIFVSSGGVMNGLAGHSGNIELEAGALLTGASGEFNILLSPSDSISSDESITIIGNDLSQATFTFDSGAVVDLSGNYWGTTDLDAIYAKLGVNASQVVINNILPSDPTTTFNVVTVGLPRNTFGRETDKLLLYFSHELDPAAISDDVFQFVSADGTPVNVTGWKPEGKTLSIEFETPAKEGRYLLRFADSIRDASGAPLETLYSAEGAASGWADTLILKAEYTPPRVVKVSPDGDFAGTLEEIQVSFSESLDVGEIQKYVTLTGPDGSVIKPLSVKAANGTAVFTVSPQTAYGRYTVTVSQELADYAGNKLDQNGNGVGGEAADTFTGSFMIADVDLKVSDVRLSADMVAPGDALTVSWTTCNNGGYALSGSWTDGVYLSADSRWDVNDILLGSVSHTGGLAENATLDNLLAVSVSGVTEDDYYILVRSDIYMQEKGDRESALAAQNLEAVPITVELPSLTVDSATVGTIAKSGDYAVYKLVQEANESLNLVLDSKVSSANMEIYVGYGYVPTREKYDAKVQKITDGNLLLDADPASRNAYVMVYSKSANQAFEYTLTAESVPMSITKVVGTTQGNTDGSVFELVGVDFTPDMVVTLTDLNGNRINADSIVFINNTKIKVEFAAGTLAVGDYSLSTSSNGKTATYDEKITIVGGSGSEFNIKFVAPSSVGWKSLTTLYVEYSNSGYDSMDAPLVIVHPHLTDGREGAFLTLDQSILTTGFWTSTKPAGFEYSVQMLATGNSPGLLEANSSTYKIPVYYASWQTPWPSITININWGVSYIDPNDTTALDWNAFLSENGKTGNEAELLANTLNSSIGTTWGDYVKMLNRNMRYLYENNISTQNVSVSDLFNMEYQWASGGITYQRELSANTDISFGTDSLELNLTRNYYSDFDKRMKSSSFGNGWSCSWDMVLNIASNGDQTFADGESTRLYQPNYSNGYQTVADDGSVMKKLRNGTYQLTESDGTTRLFDAAGLLQNITDANGDTISFFYENGKISRISAGLQSCDISRNDAGLITVITDQNGNTFHYAYDDNCNLISATVNDEITTYSYDEEKLNSLTEIGGVRSGQFAYDDSGRLSVFTQNGHSYGYDYGTTGKVTVSRDGKIIGTNYYGPNGELVKVVASDGITRGYILSGRLTDTDGDPLAGITVDAIADDTIYSSVTDADGNYAFTGLTDSVVNLAIQDQSYISTVENVEIDNIMFSDWTLTKAQNSISGTYTYMDSLEPATIILTNGTTGEKSVINGYAGKFAAYDLTAGEYTMTISAGDSATYCSNFTIGESSGYQDLGAFGLKVGGNLSYTVTSDSSLNNTVVFLYDSNGKTVAMDLLTQSGTCIFENIAEGTYTLQVNSPNGERFNVSQEVSISSLKTTETSVQVDGGVALSGKIYNANGRAMSGFLLELSDGTESTYATTDYYGRYELGPLPAGNYTLSPYGSNSPLTSFTITAGQEDITANIVTDYCASWSGHILDADGNLTNGWVSLYLDGEYLDSAYASTGYFRFDMKQAGNYSIVAESENGFFTQSAAQNLTSGSNMSSDLTLGGYSLTVTSENTPSGETEYILDLLDNDRNVCASNYSKDAVFSGLSAGKYLLTAYSGNYKAQNVFDVAGNTEQDVIFEKLNELNVRLAEITEALNLLLYNADGEVVDTLYIDEAGIYSFKALDPGNYRLVAFSDKYNAMQDVTVTTDTNIVDLVMAESTRTISGTVTVDGNVCDSAFIAVLNGNQELAGYTYTNENGYYQIALGESDGYYIQIGAAGAVTQDSPVTFEDTDIMTVNADLTSISQFTAAETLPSTQSDSAGLSDLVPAKMWTNSVLSSRKEIFSEFDSSQFWMDLTTPKVSMCPSCAVRWKQYKDAKVQYVKMWHSAKNGFTLVEESIYDLCLSIGGLIGSVAVAVGSAAVGVVVTVAQLVFGGISIVQNIDDILQEWQTVANELLGVFSLELSAALQIVRSSIDEIKILNSNLQSGINELAAAIDGMIARGEFHRSLEISNSSDRMLDTIMRKSRNNANIARLKSAEKCVKNFSVALNAFATALSALDVGEKSEQFVGALAKLDSDLDLLSFYNHQGHLRRLKLPNCPCDCDEEKDEKLPSDTDTGKSVPGGDTPVSKSVDPNDKTVSEGYGEAGWITGKASLNYKVEFENDPEFATAPARWVRVYDTLAEVFELDTFELKSICIAGNYIEVGDGRDSFNDLRELDINGDKMLTQISVNLEPETRQIFAEFTAIDPETGWMLQDVERGILLPNDEIGSGEGFFTYSVALKDGVAHGTEVSNTAKIYFDFNDPIDTPTTLNTVDSVDPAQVQITAEVGEGNLFTLTLSGSDEGSGLAGYHLYWSEDGEQFSKYCYTVETQLEIELPGETAYYFKAQAEDRVGNLSVMSESIVLSAAQTTVANDLNMDGRADIVMTIDQSGHPADGSTGAWLILADQTAAWGDLSTRNAGFVIFGTGKTAAGKNTDDVYIRSSDNVVGAWTTDDEGKVNGWETIGEFSSDTQIVGLGDFSGNGQTDLLLRNSNGAVGCFFTSEEKHGWNYFQSLGDEWKLSAIGDFNGDGRDDVVLKHDAGFAGSWLTQEDGTMAWADLDTLPDGFEIVGAGDFNGDGTDDVLLKNGGYYGAWLVNNGNAAGWMGLGDLGDVTVEQIADFNGDGKDDLRVRTSAGDLGAQLVMGEDNLVWKYYGSVGEEWKTALAALG